MCLGKLLQMRFLTVKREGSPPAPKLEHESSGCQVYFGRRSVGGGG